MTFPRDLDALVFGKEFASLILSIGLLKTQKNVLFVDDQNKALSLSSLIKINYVEKSLFQELGEKYSISTLLGMEDFVRPIQTQFLYDHKMFSFYTDPIQNIQELKRKQLTSLEKMLSVDAFFKEVDSLLQSSLHKKTETSSLLAKKFDVLNYLINFHSASSLHSFLGPQYFLDTQKLKKSLLEEFRRKGGHYKQTTLYDVKKKNHHWAIELESFEGLIYSSQIFNEENYVSHDIVIDQKKFVRWITKLNFSAPSSWDQFIFLSPEMKGTFIPYVELQREDKETLIWSCLAEETGLATTEQMNEFLEKTLSLSLKELQLPLKKIYKGFETRENPTQVFSSLLRLRDAIIKM